MVKSRRELAVFLSKLNTFSKPSVFLEQYPSDSEVAAILLWKMMLNDELEGKNILDLGSGTGILGIGALLMGAKHVIFVDIDGKMGDELKKNLEILHEHWEIDIKGKVTFICKDIKLLHKSDLPTALQDSAPLIAVSNPPFGTRRKHIDKHFLLKAIELCNSIYTMHKTSTKVFVEAFSASNSLDIAWSEDTSFPIRNTMKEHTKKIERIEVTLYNLRK